MIFSTSFVTASPGSYPLTFQFAPFCGAWSAATVTLTTPLQRGRLRSSRKSTASRAPRVGLSDREKRFVLEYLVDLSGRAAGVPAALGKNPKSAGEMAAKLRAKPHVAEVISKLLQERHGIVGSRVVGELGCLAYSKISDYTTIVDGRAVASLWNRRAEGRRKRNMGNCGWRGIPRHQDQAPRQTRRPRSARQINRPL
jgi:Terminase small subunit